MSIDTVTQRSRRALLGAAAGAVAATAIGAVARPLPALAAGNYGTAIAIGGTYLGVVLRDVGHTVRPRA